MTRPAAPTPAPGRSPGRGRGRRAARGPRAGGGEDGVGSGGPAPAPDEGAAAPAVPDPSGDSEPARDTRRALPAVDRLAEAAGAGAPGLPGWARRAGARAALAAVRAAGGPVPAPEALAADAAARAAVWAQPHPRRVVNATGVVLHTNLGRAPLAAEAAEAVRDAARHYVDLELDLESGERGDRQEPVARRLALLAGAEAALVVNNNAAALLLAVAALAGGREVIVSRGELVEIGGSFRLPEILAAAGARLVEVGTTNRTHPEDYLRAIGPESALLLKVHRSNFELRGFVAEVETPALAAIARSRGLPLVEDLGAATILDLRAHGPGAAAWAPRRLRLDADLVCFSGDKLLGGPQAGILLGAAAHIDALRRHPLARALRPDKLTLAALGWTAGTLLAGEPQAIPVLRQLLAPVDALERRARALAARLAAPAARAGLRVAVEATRVPVGGGAAPGAALPSWAVALRPPPPAGGAAAEALAAALRAAPVPVVARVADGAVLLETRALLPDDDEPVVAALDALVAAR